MQLGSALVWSLFSLVWCGVVWCDVVWCDVVWCGVVWCGVVWCGVMGCKRVYIGGMYLPTTLHCLQSTASVSVTLG